MMATHVMSRGAKNSVQHDTIIINNILPMRKKQTNWERRQNGPENQNQPTTRTARAIAADLNKQSRMTTLSENQIQESHSGLIGAERRCTEKSMSNSREYQFIYTKAINNTTIETNQTSIYHKEPTTKDRYYYVTIGMTAKLVQQRQQQQQSECAHDNTANDRAGANFQGENSMSQQQQSTTSRYTYDYVQTCMIQSISI